jgi:hypothetical protein
MAENLDFIVTVKYLCKTMIDSEALHKEFGGDAALALVDIRGTEDLIGYGDEIEVLEVLAVEPVRE